LGALAFVAAAVATPMGAFTAFGLEALVLAFVIGLSGLPLMNLVFRWLALMTLAGFLALLIAPAHPERFRVGLTVVVASILIKNSLALFMILVLAGTTPFPKLLAAFRKLGVPAILVGTLHFMERYRHVLVRELETMSTARRARTFDRRGLLSWRLLAGLVGMLFLRAFERSEGVHQAMVARGWDGVLRTLED
jgi:cobalt/nickel transport system permease protein